MSAVITMYIHSYIDLCQSICHHEYFITLYKCVYNALWILSISEVLLKSPSTNPAHEVWYCAVLSMNMT